MEELIGKTLGNYKILEKIGQGGMAQVFKAHQLGLERLVAIKILSPALATDPDFAARFRREARSIAHLQHPHILQVYDFGVQDHYYYLAMHYVADSRTLADLIRRGCPPAPLIEYLAQVADALDYAHKQGVVHRDIKPSNILIDHRWGALLADFGLVKIAESDSDLTRTGARIGTPAYMSPEQAMGEKIDSAADIYALGIILYEIMTGKVPHDASTPQGILTRRTVEPVLPPRQFNSTISPAFERVILQALARNPADRYKTAADLKTAIITAQKDSADQTVTRLKDTLPHLQAPLFPVSAKKKIWGLVGGVAAVLILGIAFMIYQFFSADGTGQESAGPSETVTSLPVVELPTPTSLLPEPSRVNLKAELAVLAGPGAEEPVLYYLPEGASAELIGRDRAGEWWQIRTSRGEGWLRADPDSAEVTGLEYTPIVAVLTPTPLASETPTPTATATSTPTEPPPSPTATQIPSSTPTATNTSQPTPTATTKAVPSSPTSTPTATPTARLASLELPAPQLVDYNGTSFSWKWEGESQIGSTDWYFDIKIFKGLSAPEPYDVFVAEPEQTRYANGLWSFDATPNFQCGSSWAVQIAQRQPDGSYAGPLSAESNRLLVGPACGGGGDGGGGSGNGNDGGVR